MSSQEDIGQSSSGQIATPTEQSTTTSETGQQSRDNLRALVREIIATKFQQRADGVNNQPQTKSSDATG